MKPYFEQRVKVLHGLLLVPLVPVEVWQVREAVPHADDGVEAGGVRGGDVLGEGQPVCLLDHLKATLACAKIGKKQKIAPYPICQMRPLFSCPIWSCMPL